MSPKNSSSSRGGVLTASRLTIAVLAVLAVIFIFENTRHTKIRLLIPEITMPLWMALLGMGVIGWLCGRFFVRR